MKQYKAYLLLYFLSFSLWINAQSIQDILESFGNTVSVNNTLINDAVCPALSIVRQQFRLERNGQFYGKNNKPFYGESYSLSVKVSGGELFQNKVLCPWHGDSDYERVNKTSKYKPARFRSYQRLLNDSLYKEVDLELETGYVYPFNKDSLIFMHSDAHSDFGLHIDDRAGLKDGYVIWVYASNANDSAMRVSLKQTPYKLEANCDSVYTISPKESEKVLGGIFVVPTIERAGIIRISLIGICAKSDETGWQLCLMTKDDKNKVAKKKKKAEKRKSDGTDGAEPTPIK